PGGLTPSRLRCEYRTDPLGVDVTSPRLSWIVESTGRGQRQTAYQVLVAGDADTLGRDQGDLWDSGRVDSDETTAIAYAGQPLRSHQPCSWKVRVWDKDGQASAWSWPGHWSMGLLGPSDWGSSSWIGWDKTRPADRPEAPSQGKPKVAKLVLPPPVY